MKELMNNDLKNISGGTNETSTQNQVNFYDSGLMGTVTVPPSAHGQTVHLTVNVTENGGLLSKIFG